MAAFDPDPAISMAAWNAQQTNYADRGGLHPFAKTLISSHLPSSPSEDTLVLLRYQRPWGLATTPCLISLAHIELCSIQQDIESIFLD